MARYIQSQGFWQSQKMWSSTHTSPPKQGLIVVTVWKLLLKKWKHMPWLNCLFKKKFFLVFELKSVCYNVYLFVKVLWPRLNSLSLFVYDILKPSLSWKLLLVSILQMWHSGLNTIIHIWLNTNYGRKGKEISLK